MYWLCFWLKYVTYIQIYNQSCKDGKQGWVLGCLEYRCGTDVDIERIQKSVTLSPTRGVLEYTIGGSGGMLGENCRSSL